MKIFMLVILISMFACRPCETPEIIENPPIHDSILSKVPYANAQIIKLKHSNGHVINFIVNLDSSTYISECERYNCCDYLFRYTNYRINLVPDYPIFSIDFSMSNLDYQSKFISVFIANSTFYFSYDFNLNYGCQIIDSIYLNNRFYYDVMMVPHSGVYDNSHTFPDTLLYNYEYGILKIKISNNEFFTITD